MKLLIISLFLFSANVLYADESEVLFYADKKYNYYGKCLDEALPRNINNDLVFQCYGEASSKIRKLIIERIKSYGECFAPLNPISFQCDIQRSQKTFELYRDTECLMRSTHSNTISGLEFPQCHYNMNRNRLIQLDHIRKYGLN